MKLSNFKKIYIYDNWGHKSYHFSKDYKDSAICFKHGQKIKVKFKDGTVSSAPIFQDTIHETVHDMGHSYNVSSVVYSLKLKLNGHSVFIPIEDVKVSI